MKVQALSSLKPPLKYNQGQMPLINQGLPMAFLTVWELLKYAVSD